MRTEGAECRIRVKVCTTRQPLHSIMWYTFTWTILAVCRCVVVYKILETKVCMINLTLSTHLAGDTVSDGQGGRFLTLKPIL